MHHHEHANARSRECGHAFSGRSDETDDNQTVPSLRRHEAGEIPTAILSFSAYENVRSYLFRLSPLPWNSGPFQVLSMFVWPFPLSAHCVPVSSLSRMYLCLIGLIHFICSKLLFEDVGKYLSNTAARLHLRFFEKKLSPSVVVFKFS